MPRAKGKSLCETSAQESSTNPSLAKTKLSTQKGDAAGAAAKAAAQSRVIPAVVNWNVLETAPAPPTLLLCPGGGTEHEYGSQIVSQWLFDLAVWVGKNHLVEMQGVVERWHAVRRPSPHEWGQDGS